MEPNALNLLPDPPEIPDEELIEIGREAGDAGRENYELMKEIINRRLFDNV